MRANEAAGRRPRREIQAKHADRLCLILSNFDQAETAEHMDLPSLALHQLKGERKGTWTVRVSGDRSLLGLKRPAYPGILP